MSEKICEKYDFSLPDDGEDKKNRHKIKYNKKKAKEIRKWFKVVCQFLAIVLAASGVFFLFYISKVFFNNTINGPVFLGDNADVEYEIAQNTISNINNPELFTGTKNIKTTVPEASF